MLPMPLSDRARAAFDALSTGAIVLARPDHVHLEFAGPKAADVLTGLVTNDVLALAPGEAQYAVALTPKGKVLAELRIVRVAEERYITSSPPPSGEAWLALVRKFVNPRLAKYGVLPHTTVSVLGPAASAVCDGLALDAELLRLPTEVLDGVPGFDLLVPAEQVDALMASLQADARVTAGDAAALDVARIAEGRPRAGVDMDDTTIPQEANLGDFAALSFTKGCYTGQETVARLHFRGHVNKSLRRLTAISPAEGPIALGMVRREVTAGATVWAHLGDAEPIEVSVAS